MPARATALTLACAITASSTGVLALGVGRLPSGLVLGQPLHLAVPVRLEAGESLEPGCVSAEVLAGETRWSRDAVRVRLEPAAGTVGPQPAVAAQGPGAWLIRLSSSQVVDEPVVEITLTVGCESRLSRRFTALADPPGMAPVMAEALLPATSRAEVPLAGGMSTRAEAPVPARALSARAQRPQGPRQLAQLDPLTRNASPASAASVAPAKAAAPVAQVPVPASQPNQPRRRPAEPARPPSPAPVAAAGGRLLLEVAPPRLKLDIDGPVVLPPVAAASQGAAGGLPGGDGEAGAAASGAADAGAVSEAQRLHALERTLKELQREGRGDPQALAALRQQLEAAEGRGRALPWLATALALALGVAGWLAWRLRRGTRTASADRAWWDESPPPEPAAGEGLIPFEPLAPAPSDLSPLGPLPPGDPWLTDPPASAPATLPQQLREPDPAPAPAVEAEAERTVVEPARPVAPPPVLHAAVAEPAAEHTAEPEAKREVSLEELLDLEQQADFFIALGQEDAAIDLLMSHLRGSGGMSPLPYTKLLEIFHRQQDHEGYERIRTRFNQRFNAYAPDWDQGPLSGRHLEDYADVVAWLQACWHDPVEAMARLEALLFRREGSGELFDLPAYRDVLLLYALARDVAQQSGVELEPVDVLLPLAGEDG